MKVVFANTSDDNKPSGGAKQAYRHIDVLNQLGIDACFVHPTKGFRYDWFENKTRIAHIDDVELTADDFLIYGELVPEVPRVKGWDRCGKVVLCQNDYNALAGFRLDLMNIRWNFRESNAILCPSDNAVTNMKFMFPSSRVMRFRYSFDRQPWEFNANKDKLVAVMPRKRATQVDALVAVTALKWMPPGWNLGRIDGISERDVANALKRSGLFLSMSEREGFGMPPAEAMACGCIVVGYTGYGGDEFMVPGVTFPVADGDYLGMTRAMMGVFKMSEDERLEMGHKASVFIRSTYSSKAEVESIETAWKKIARPRIELHTDTRERMKKDVAAYMPVYNEGPYMETLLRWLIPRVGAIFVAESIVPWSPNAKPGGESKAIVDKVLADCPEAKDIIRYIPVGSALDKGEPLIREANQRNEILAKIRESGFKYVWMVEADEFYRNDEAEALWSYFFDKAETDGARVANCQWQTYWRSIHWRVDPPEMFRPNVAFLSDVKFDHGRVLTIEDEGESVEVPERLCVVRHYSWARTPADTKNKLAAWGHSKELNPEWYDKVFMAWTPGAVGANLHPTKPQNYRSVVKCSLPIPEAMKGHPFLGREIITDEPGMLYLNPNAKVTLTVKDDRPKRKYRVKAVIMHHNKPENADRLYEQLAPVFDDVEIFDNGSDPNLVPIHTTRSRENVYWTGTWNEVMKTCSEYDAVWVLGCDLVLLSHPGEYREAIENSLPFGCWSPCIQGRAHPFMQEANYSDENPKEVRNIEGMALAVSGSLMRLVGELVPGSKIGFGQDFWLCYRARKAGMKNVIDGRVVILHPEGIGYDEAEASRQMEETFGRVYGSDFRRTIFEYDERFEQNLIGGPTMLNGKRFTVVTVDNGWGLSEFCRIATKLSGARLIVMRKGVMEGVSVPGVEFVPYSEDLTGLIQDADVAFFPRVGAANEVDFLKMVKAGVAVVVRESGAKNAITHMKNGWLFRDDTWASHWLSYLRDNPKEIERVKAESGASVTGLQEAEKKGPKVTVITPTYHRDLKVVHHCIDCMLLQTEKDWEQVVCSDGEYEPDVEKLVKTIGDPRVRYCHTVGKKDGDFGNTVRSEMLAQATGQYVFFFDDDNLILPNYLERMLAVLTFGEGADYAVCKVMHFGPLNEKEIGKPPMVLTGDPVRLYHIDPLQVVVRRELMQKIGWDTKVGYLSDGVSLEKLAPHKIVRVNEVLGIHT